MTIVQIHKNKVVLKQSMRGVSSFQRHRQKLHSENRCHSSHGLVAGKIDLFTSGSSRGLGEPVRSFSARPWLP